MAHEVFDTVIVGGGQAGLATGYHLAKRGRSFVILDASERVGDPWRKRWDSLRLYSPAGYDGLPGLRFPAKRTAYPTAGEMADYLEAYAAHFALPVRSGIAVDTLARASDRYVLTAGDSTFEAENVVVATGVMQKPHVPDFAPALDPRVTQLHSNDYRNPSQLQDGPVLVVGASHSGADIAHEVAATHRDDSLRGRHRADPCRRRHAPGAHGLPPARLRGQAHPHDGHAAGAEDAAARPSRRGTAAALPAEGSPRRGGRANARAHGRRGGRPARARGRSRARRPERRLVHRVPAGLLVDRGSVRDGRRRVPGAVPRRRPLCAGALLRRAALPALVHVDARLRARAGTRSAWPSTSCPDPRVGCPPLGLQPRSRHERGAGHEDRPSIASHLERARDTPRAEGHPSDRGVSVRDMSRWPSEEA